MSHVLVVDDEPAICWSLRELLRDDGHEVTIASSAEEAIAAAGSKRPDAIVLDVRLPGMDGLSAMAKLKKVSGSAPIIVMTAFGNLETAVRAVDEGAFDYLTKPFELDEAADAIRRALALSERDRSTAKRKTETGNENEIVGTTPTMQSVFRQVALVAASSAPVLITGESGTGKGLVARAIHANGSRRDGPFVAVSLPALDERRIERELFGEMPEPTGKATKKSHRKGLLETADGGTVLLDEVGDIPPALQVKLLRAIEEQEVVPVGSTQPVSIDVRVLSATNRDLSELMASGGFREDLFFRLSVVQIALPPLRDRVEDVPLLARHFVNLAGSHGEFSPSAMCELSSRLWPGNVRELRNAVENAALVARGGSIEVSHLPPALTHSGGRSLDPTEDLRAATARWIKEQLRPLDLEASDAALYEDFLTAAEPALLETILTQVGNNRTAAARLLGLHRATLRQKLQNYGLPRET
ncbi:MAG: sigma-54 dependent transcriptional regulator [Planctomycetota bacterium]|nr:sigma-54 dependent transcriptional regulator [Planctomycetota bacterium]MDA1252180.1 sigma-54 dependent transcriptional regulator [Planctomycetota bacterium]